MAKGHSNKSVADWMLRQVEAGPLYQWFAAEKILELFGPLYVHQNPDHPLTIQQGVLKAFKDTSRDTVVWQEDMRCWRLREPEDGPDRTQ